MDEINFKILNYSGQLMYENVFTGSEYKLSLNIPKGLYFIKYIDSKGNPAFVKMIKL